MPFDRSRSCRPVLAGALWLALVGVAATTPPELMAKVQPVVRAAPPGDAVAWTRFFGADYHSLLVVHDARRLDTPGFARPFEELSRFLTVAPEKSAVAGAPSPASSPASATTSPVSVVVPRQLLVKLTRAARQEKLIVDGLIELVPLSGAIGFKGSWTKPSVLLAIRSSERLWRLLAVARVQLAEELSRSKAGPGIAFADLTIEGAPAVKMTTREGTHLLIARTGDTLIAADSEAEVGAAIRLFRDSKARTVVSNRFFSPARGRIKSGAVAFAVVSPGSFLHDLASLSLTQFPPEMRQGIQLFGQLFEATFLQLTAEPGSTQLELVVELDRSSQNYRHFNLDDRSRFFLENTLKAAESTPSDSLFLLNLFQTLTPGRKDPSLNPAIVGKGTAVLNEQQWLTLKGQAQMFTGLDIEKDVVPWLGPEAAVAARRTKTAGVEFSVLLESIDSKATQAAVDKALRHLTFTQNRTFAEQKIGRSSMRVAAPTPASPLTPAVALTERFLVIGTGPEIVEATVGSPRKLTATEDYIKLVAALRMPRLNGFGYLNIRETDSLLTSKGQAPQGHPMAKLQQFVTSLAADLASMVVGVSAVDERTFQMVFQVRAK
ncbi:MAG: DUF3352 domain-containing protein [Candidatus Riflebacteria bacterium]|nr:DUF3352 domain-containing protein [Candidatus Riflebacteria bacterium]